MRFCTLLAAAILASSALTAHGDAPRSTAELQALHAAWFTAFDTGDGAAMDQMEMPNLVLVMPDGSVWEKSEPRARTMKQRTLDGSRELSDVTVREFGETALLTGTVTSKTATETESDSTTVVFVKNGGKWKIASAQWTPKTPPPNT